MHDNREVAVIIPALNESRTIGGVVSGAVALGYEVYVVDDASSDDTAARAFDAGAKVLRLPFSLGAWGAIQAGMLHAMKKGRYLYFCTMDGDGQHWPALIPELLNNHDADGVNVVIGSCPQRGGLSRRFVWRLFSTLTGLDIRDLTSGFRLYDRDAVRALLTREATMFDYQDIGVLLLLRRRGLRCMEVPVDMYERRNGRSRIFGSWMSIMVYLVKSCLCVVADWVSGSTETAEKWTEYDVI